MGRFPHRVHKAFSKINVLFMSSESQLFTLQPLLYQLINFANNLSILGGA